MGVHPPVYFHRELAPMKTDAGIHPVPHPQRHPPTVLPPSVVPAQSLPPMKTEGGNPPPSVSFADAGPIPTPASVVPTKSLPLVKTRAGTHPPNPHPLQTPSPYCYP